MSANDKASLTPPKTAPQDGRYARLWDRPGFLVRRLHQIHVALFYEACAGSQITPVQFGVLSILYEGEARDQRRLGAEVGIDRTNVADVLARLEARGLIERVVNASDRRMKLASITAAGRSFVEQLQGSMERAQERLIAPLAEDDRAVFMRCLHQLVQANNDVGRAQLRAGLVGADGQS